MADAHLDGSLNPPSADDVFRTVAAIAGDSITKIPRPSRWASSRGCSQPTSTTGSAASSSASASSPGGSRRRCCSAITCYGDAPSEESEGRHWKEPADTSKLVAVANAVTERAARPLDWFSMPVPLSRDDDAYFEPLADLRLHDRTPLYLGLVHHTGGVEGTQRRIDTARRHCQREFGVATECGMGRKPRERVPELLEIQAQVRV